MASAISLRTAALLSLRAPLPLDRSGALDGMGVTGHDRDGTITGMFAATFFDEATRERVVFRIAD